jgi:hypothetical protein
MSVFVNLGVVADAKKDNAILTSRTKGQDIVANPSNYSVGVNRFKIPLSQIPLFRVYDGDLQLGLYCNNPANYHFSEHGTHLLDSKFYRNNVFGNFINDNGVAEVNISSGLLVNYGSENGVAFKEFYSQSEFADYLNLALIRVFGHLQGGNFTASGSTDLEDSRKIMKFQNAGTHEFNTDLTNLTNVIGDGSTSPLLNKVSGRRFLTCETPLGINQPHRVPGNVASDKFYKFNRGKVQSEVVPNTSPTKTFLNETLSTTHRYITQIDVKITNLIGLDINGLLPNFKDFSIWLRRVPIDENGSETSNESIGRLQQGDYDNWCLCQNMFDGLNSTTAKIIHISSIVGATTTRDNKNADNFLASSNTDYYMSFDYTTIKDIIGKRGDGYKYEVYTMNNYEYNNKNAVANTTPYFATIPGNFQVSIEFNSITALRTIEPISGNNTGRGNYVSDTLGTQDRDLKLVPYFNYNPNTKKFEYNISNHYLLGMGFNLIMNNKLAEMLSFNNLVIDECSTQAHLEKYIDYSTQLPYDADNDNCVVIYPKPNYGNMGVNRNSKSSWFSMNKYEEQANSEFKRDWLNGIVITSSGLAIGGEIVGDGSQTRKILTDFQIDPTSVGRDYLIFTNSGGMRLYEIKSTQPLKDIQVQIQFQDNKGLLRDLIIGFNEECNLKLEFRPNAQLYSLNQEVSSFNY